jgi:hypothetical protein
MHQLAWELIPSLQGIEAEVRIDEEPNA